MSSGNSKITVGYKYFLDLQQIICRGPIDLISRIRGDEKTAFEQVVESSETITIEAEGLYGTPNTIADGISGDVELAFGGTEQTASSYLESAIGSDLPAYRGIVSAIFKQFYFGNSAYLKSIDYRATRILTRQDGEAQWYPSKAAIGAGLTVYASEYDGDFFFIELTINQDGEPTFLNPDGAIINTTWSGPTGTVKVRVRGLIQTRDYYGEYESVIGTVIKGGNNAPGAGEPPLSESDVHKPMYRFQNSSAGEEWNLNSGTTDAVQAIDYTFYITLTNNDVISFKCENTGQRFVGSYQNLRLTLSSPSTTAAGDMNPAHIIYECITDPDWGLGIDEYEIDEASFMSAADTLYSEGLGLSFLLSRESLIEDFIQRVADHIDGAMFVDRQTGQFRLKLIRDDYDENTLLEVDEDAIVDVETYQENNLEDAINSVTVRFRNILTDQTDSVTVDNPALINKFGVRKGQTLEYEGISNKTNASKVAERELRGFSAPLISAVLITNRFPASLNVGDVFKFLHAEYHDGYLVMRITKIEYGDSSNNMLRISCTQDVFSTPSTGIVSVEESSFVSLAVAATDVERKIVTEMPYYEMVQKYGETDTNNLITGNSDIGYLAVAASRNSSSELNADVQVDDGTGYELGATLDFSPSALLGVPIGYGSTNIDVTDGKNMEDLTTGMWGVINGEIIRVDSVSETSSGYSLVVGRACLDTVPKEHAVGDLILFWSEEITTDNVEYTASDTLGVKILPTSGTGTLAIASATESSLTFNSRAVRPYPPGKLEIDSNSYPVTVDYIGDPLIIRWAHRDRLQETGPTILIDDSDESVGPEAGTTYNLRIYHYDYAGSDEDSTTDVLIVDETGLTNNQYSFLPPSVQAGVYLLELESVRDGYLSWTKYEFMFEILAEFDSQGVPDSSPSALFVVLPLTYDEEDYNNEMTWTRQGDSPHVTPQGFEGDGWNARMTSTTLPTWLTTANEFLIHATVSFYDERPQNAAGEIALYFGENAAGVSPNPTAALRVLQDPEDATRAYLEFQTYTGTLQQQPLFRPFWKYQFRFPVLNNSNGEARPQCIYFIDSTTVLVGAHYEDLESVIYRVDLTDNSVTGEFTFGPSTHRHISSIAEDSAGNVWVSDFDTGHTLQIDLANSISSGLAVIDADWDTSVLSQLGAIGFATSGGTNYVLLQEYASTGTPYLYVVAESEMGDGLTFAIGDRFKRFDAGQRAQGLTLDFDSNGGNLWISKNRDVATSTLNGWMEDYGDADSLISSTSDGATISPIASYPGPTQYVEDIKFHPGTQEIWTLSEGWQSVGDYDGFLGIWSSSVDGTLAENHITAHYNGSGTFTIRLNNEEFQTLSLTPSQDVEIVSIGGPPQASEEFVNGFFRGFIRNVRFQNQDFSGSEYDDTIAETSSAFEPNTLTEYTVTMTNPGAETGDTTGWTNETGSLGVRTANPTPYEGSYYFFGGPNAATTSRQRFDLTTVTGLSGAQIDAGGIWAKVKWRQASFTDQDPVTMGIRMLDSVPSQISLTYGHQDWVEDGNSGATQNWRTLTIGVDVPSSTRNIDAVYDATRTSGTNLDGYVDAIEMVVYRQ